MSHEDEQYLKTVDTASGDFQPNPIYGDAPPSYADGTTYNNNDPNMQQQDENYEYPEHEQQQQQQQNDDDEEEEDVSDPFGNNQEPDEEEYETCEEEEEEEYEIVPQQKPPPPYSEDPPQPPETYNGNHIKAQEAEQEEQEKPEQEPEDVVAQMNAMNTTNDDSDEEVGDYGVTQPKVDDTTHTDAENGLGLFGNFFIRTVFMACSILICSILAFAIWFQKSSGDFSAGFGISAFAAVMLFLASLMAIIFATLQKFNRPIPAEKFVFFSIVAIYIIGGLFYFLGGCAIAYAWNTIGASYFGGIFFAEQTFVGLHAIIAGVDLWKRKILNNKKWRVIIYNIAFILVSVIAFFAFAVTSTKFDKAGLDNAGPAFLALFYFLVLIPEILYLVIYLIPKLNEMLGKPIILVILAGMFYLFVVCILVGYFIILGDFEGVKGRAYWLGVGFFILACGTVIAFDMMFDKFIPGYKDGGSSVSDQTAAGGSSAVVTFDPDDADPDYD